MLAIIEEKRKRIREYRDEEMMLNGGMCTKMYRTGYLSLTLMTMIIDSHVNVPQTRNRRRTRGAAAAAVAAVNGLSAAELTLEQVLRNKNNSRTSKRRYNDHILFSILIYLG